MAVLVRNRVRVTVRCKVRIRVRAKLFRVRSRVSSRVRVMSSECHLSWCVAFRQTHRPIVPVSTMGVCTYESVYCLIFVKHLKLHSANSEHVQVYFWTSSPALPASEEGFQPMPSVTVRPADDNHLPTANTCISRLYIPLYSSKLILRQKLLLSIKTKSFGFV